MTTVDVLRAARKRIEDPERWCQGALARDAAGDPVVPTAKDACEWCVVGAVLLESGTGETIARYDSLAGSAVARIGDALRGSDVEEWNDIESRRHATVLKALDRAIAAEKAKASVSR